MERAAFKGSTNYRPRYLLDDVGNKNALAALDASTKPSKGGNFRVTVSGVLHSDGKTLQGARCRGRPAAAAKRMH